MNTKFNDFISESAYEKVIVLQNKNNRNNTITITVGGSRIKDISKTIEVRFPYQIGQPFNRGIETWATNNGFLYNGEDLSNKNKKVFGIRTKDIPQGHELRQLYPNKFK